MSLRRVAFGTAAMSSVNVLRLGAQFFALPLLARLLSPHDYGVVGMAMPFLAFTLMFADAGIGMSLVRSPAADRRAWSTCFWLSALLGAGLALLMAGAAPLVARGFGEAALAPIVAALGFSTFAQALATIPLTMLQQQHRFPVIAGIEIVSIGAGLGAAVVVALHGGGAWALVAQSLVYFGVRLPAALVLSPFRPAFVFDLGAARPHLAFGRDMLSVNLINFFTRSLDNLVIGRVLGPAAVGYYSMAFQFVRLPLMVMTGPLQYVLYAQLARLNGDIPAIRRLFLILVRLVATVGLPVVAVVAAAHGPIFQVFLSEKWAPAARLYTLMAPIGALQQLTALAGTTMVALGRTDTQRITAAEAGGLWLAVLLVTVWFGLDWVGIAYSAAVLGYGPRLLRRVLPLIDCTLGMFARAALVPAIAALLCIGAYEGLVAALAPSAWRQIGCAAAIAILGVLGAALAQRRVLLAGVGTWHRPPAPRVAEASPAS